MIDWFQAGKWLVVFGIAIIFLGGALIVFGRLAGKLEIPSLGHLPGDIHIQRKGFSFHFFLATSIVLSVLLTIVLNLIVRLLRR